MNNRQAGRRRGRGGQRPGGSPGRTDNGNRIDSRARGNAAQLLEKYKNLARDAQMGGDRVNTEYYLQFADHYFRVLSESRSRFEDGNGRRPSNDIADDDDDDYGYEGEIASPGGYNSQAVIAHDDEREPRRDTVQRDGQQRDGQQRDGQRRDPGERPRQAGRDDGERAGNGHASERPVGDGSDRPRRAERDGTDRAERPRRAERDQGSEAPRRDPRPNRAERLRQPERSNGGDQAELTVFQEASAPADVTEPQQDASPVVIAQDVPEQPRRRGRPRREPVAEVTAEVFDAALLPPSLNIEAMPVAGEDQPVAEERPRRRRRVRGDDEATPPVA